MRAGKGEQGERERESQADSKLSSGAQGPQELSGPQGPQELSRPQDHELSQNHESYA